MFDVLGQTPRFQAFGERFSTSTSTSTSTYTYTSTLTSTSTSSSFQAALHMIRYLISARWTVEKAMVVRCVALANRENRPTASSPGNTTTMQGCCKWCNTHSKSPAACDASAARPTAKNHPHRPSLPANLQMPRCTPQPPGQLRPPPSRRTALQNAGGPTTARGPRG
jgi:hypothetical protein